MTPAIGFQSQKNSLDSTILIHNALWVSLSVVKCPEYI